MMKISSLYLLYYLLSSMIWALLLSLSLGEEVEANIVKTLPGYPGDLPFTFETGYVGVGETEDVQLFYYFTESQRDVERDPLLLWLTGGPGCSSLSGLLFEIGPFRFNLTASTPDSSKPKLQQNPYSWTKIASVIFLDSPVGAGFSYARSYEGYHSNDTLQSLHIYDFLRKWLVKHPKFTESALYISGESYAGTMTPFVVQEILEGNKLGLTPKMNLQGYIAGNPVDRNSKLNENFKYAHKVSLLSDELYESAMISCKGDFTKVDANNTQCLNKIQAMNQDIKGINGAHVLEQICAHASPKPKRKLPPHTYKNSPHRLLIDEYGCRGQQNRLAYLWADDKEVREALHIRKGSVGRWTRCNYSISYELNVPSPFEYHLNFSRKESLQVLIYSGDQDMIMPYLGTLEWVNQLELPISKDWAPWFVDGQVAGYVTEFSIRTYGQYRLVYTTIKGGGHTAPAFKPRECFAMMERWFSLKIL